MPALEVEAYRRTPVEGQAELFAVELPTSRRALDVDEHRTAPARYSRSSRPSTATPARGRR